MKISDLAINGGKPIRKHPLPPRKVFGEAELIIKMISTSLMSLIKDGLTLIALLSLMFYQNWKLSLLAIIMIPLASAAAKSLGKRIGKVSTEAMVKAGALNTYLIEIFKNHKLIKIFQTEEYENNRAKKYIDELKEKSKKIGIVFIRATPIMETLTGIMIAILIFYTGKLILKNEIDINSFFSFLAAMMLAYQPVRTLATLNIGVNQGIAAANRILPIVDNENEITDKNNDKTLQLIKGTIKFKEVSFKYNKNVQGPILKSLNLTIEGGKMTALVGHSGAGKSTIMNLIPRFYDCVDGDIIIDGSSIYKTKISSLRKNISLVSQDTTLFDDTIKNNIAFGLNANDINQEVILKSLELSRLKDYVSSLEKKENTVIGNRGIRISGGQKQRIGIARALYHNHRILILDEATSSLDTFNERKIMEEIYNTAENVTLIIVTHRHKSVSNCDKIYLLDKGKIIDEGKFADLEKRHSF